MTEYTLHLTCPPSIRSRVWVLRHAVQPLTAPEDPAEGAGYCDFGRARVRAAYCSEGQLFTAASGDDGTARDGRLARQHAWALHLRGRRLLSRSAPLLSIAPAAAAGDVPCTSCTRRQGHPQLAAHDRSHPQASLYCNCSNALSAPPHGGRPACGSCWMRSCTSCKCLPAHQHCSCCGGSNLPSRGSRTASTASAQESDIFCHCRGHACSSPCKPGRRRGGLVACLPNHLAPSSL